MRYAAPVLHATLLFCLASLAATAQAVELFRWKDDKGITHYSDKPPPDSVRKYEVRKITGNVVEGQESYAMKSAAQRNPILLYATDCGLLCDQARDHLARRGVPFNARNPELSSGDLAELKKLINSTEVPVLVVGREVVKGYDATRWDAVLNTAGYPANATRRGGTGTPSAPPAPSAVPAASTPVGTPAPSSTPSSGTARGGTSSTQPAAGTPGRPSPAQIPRNSSSATTGSPYRGSSVSTSSAGQGAGGDEQVTSWPSAYLAR